VRLDIEDAARACGNPKGANMVLLGMAAPAISILEAAELRAAIGRVFARKGDAIVAANQKAFDLGLEAGLGK
jgi:indolepyruvate ferredoxin oxidoreductase beta subunit